MPSRLHEVLIELFRQRPMLVVELLAGGLGMGLPAHREVRIEPGDFTDVTPTQYQADAVVVLVGESQPDPVLGVVVEVQLARDEGKWWSWPVYLTTLRARLRCPTLLLVVCVDQTTARWCARPMDLHPDTRLTPLVLGPDRVPVVTDPALAAWAPELAVLSAMAHGAGPNQADVLGALVTALGSVDQERFSLYSDVVLAALPEAARRHLEDLVKIGTYEYEYQSEFVRRYIGQGRAEGRVDALLTVLAARGVDVPEPARSRITACADVEQLDLWLRRAATAGMVDDLFD